MMKIAGLLLFVLFTISMQPIFSLNLNMPVERSKGDFDFDILLHNTRSEKPDTSRLECYFKTSFERLQFVKAGSDSFKAEIEITIDILSSKGEPVVFKKSVETIEVDDFNLVGSASNYHSAYTCFELPPDDYEVTVRVKDLETDLEGEAVQTVTLRDFSLTYGEFSDIMILDQAPEVTAKGTKFTPRIGNFHNGINKLFSHFYIYNLLDSTDAKLKYWMVYSEDNIGEENELSVQSKNGVAEVLLELSFNDFAHGTFLLKLSLQTRGAEVLQEKEIKLFVEGVPLQFETFEQAVKALKYLGEKKEYQQIVKAAGTEKYRQFVKFWKKRDPTPLTSENELRNEYYGRVVYANQKYHHMGREGWQTDRGWVYVMLGPPDSVERNPFVKEPSLEGKNIKAIQVWTYYKFNRSLYFYDDIGFGNYWLANTLVFYDMIR